MNTSKCIEVYTPSGELLFSVRISNSISSEISNKGNGNGRNKGSNGKTDSELMTDAQKRYLFRLMIQQGKEGDDALNELLNLFQTDSLQYVSKFEASKMIERLLEEAE